MLELLRELTKDKNVLLLGFGREGKSTFNALKKAGGCKKIAIADINEITPPDESVQTFCGADYQAVMDDFDIVFKSPGIVLEKKHHRCMVTSQTNVFLKRYASNTIGITGTKGKSTTTTLLYHVLCSAGADAVMVGNIGIPCFDRIAEINDTTKIVFELSCHQLEYADVSPHIALIINLFEEHLDHYGTAERYFAAKKNIYRFQSQSDMLFCGVQCEAQLENVKAKKFTISGGEKTADVMVKDGVISAFGSSLKLPLSQIHLLGEHNQFNLASVYAIAKKLGISDDDYLTAIKSYAPPPHRLEFFGSFGGVDYYDDSISTISETCKNAVKAVKNAKTILIGGMDRGIDYTDLEEFISCNRQYNYILMYDSGKRILDELKAKNCAGENVYYANDLSGAAALAKEITPVGGACILSPAAASYGVFKNFEERGECFKRLVKENYS